MVRECPADVSYTHPTLILHSSYPLRMHFIAFWLSYMMYDLTPKACKAHRLTDECPPNTYTPRQPTHARMWREKGGFTEPSYNLIILQPSYGVGWDLEPWNIAWGGPWDQLHLSHQVRRTKMCRFIPQNVTSTPPFVGCHPTL